MDAQRIMAAAHAEGFAAAKEEAAAEADPLSQLQVGLLWARLSRAWQRVCVCVCGACASRARQRACACVCGAREA